MPVWEGPIVWAAEISNRSSHDALEVVQVDAVPGEEKPAIVLALLPCRPLRPIASRNAGAVDSGEVVPTGWVRPGPTLQDIDGPCIPPQDRIPRIRFAAQFPNVASLKQLALPSQSTFSGRQSIRARGDEFSMNPG